MPHHPYLSGGHPHALAHRGGALEEVENSPSAFQRAVDLGFGFIETDVRASRDGVAIVFHDASLDRTTDHAGEVAAAPAAGILATRLANGDHPVTLAEALRRWPATRFNVDVKSDDAIGPFLRAVAAEDAWDRVCAASFSTRRLRRLRTLAGPRLATSLGPSEVARLVLRAPGRLAGCAAQVPPMRRPVHLVTAGFVRAAHARGLLVHVWTVDEAPAMHALLDLGVDGIVTDRPSVLRDVLVQRDQWS